MLNDYDAKVLIGMMILLTLIGLMAYGILYFYETLKNKKRRK